MIKLAEYAEAETGIVYCESDGTYAQAAERVSDSLLGYRGFYQIRKIGLWKSHNAFIACYLDGETIVVVIDGRRLCVSIKDKLTVGVKKKIPLYRTFSLGYVDSIVSVSYWWPWNKTWPDDGDIFSFIQRSIADISDRSSFISYWKGKVSNSL
jgi:hypothetical protein